MARHNNRNGVQRVGKPDRADRLWLADSFCQLAIRDCAPSRDGSQRSPNLPLKRRAPCAGRDLVQSTVIACEVGPDMATQTLWIISTTQRKVSIALVKQRSHAIPAILEIERTKVFAI